MRPEFKLWPFDEMKPEAAWSEFDRHLFAFMCMAYEEGFQPRMNTAGNAIDAGQSHGRWLSLVFRGVRNGWEPWLGEGERCHRLGPRYALPLGECVCVRPPFRSVGYFALEWLRGRSMESLLEEFTFVGGKPAGIEFNGVTRGASRLH
jgi:hypothetical protein